MHHLGCASCHVYVMVFYHVVCSFPVLLLLVSSGNVVCVRIRSTTSVCLLHGLVLLPCGISSKMTIPSKSLLSLLASCSFYRYVTLPTTCYIMPHILPCQASNPPFLADHCLATLPLCSTPLIALLVAGEDWSFVPCWNMFIVGISLLYLVYFNAPIYLVKGGRLGLMTGVLFHSCRPSFRRTGVMFLDFAFLMRLGVMGTP